MVTALVTSFAVLSLICSAASEISARPSTSVKNVTVQTSSGLLQGAQVDSVYKFLSVPYAEPPVGALRFQRPVELSKEAQATMVDASKLGKTCPQYRHLTRFISPLLDIDHEHQTSEDCLHLNIYVPTSVGSARQEDNRLQTSAKQLPVIVWIPGEGFDFADARQFDGSTLAQQTKSIVVTVQYRVGVLGFLHAPKLNIQGNMGLHDQLMALRWVKKNIGSFGGDSDQVTLMGRFTGSMSISALVTAPNQQLIRTPSGELLFNKVALLSGVAVPDWIIDSNQAQRAQKLEDKATERGYCSLEQVQDGSCLANMTVEQLMSVADYGWRLVVDKELVGEMSPVDAIEAGQLAQGLQAVMIGETAQEGTLCLYRHLLESGTTNFAQLIEEDKLSADDLFDVINYDSQVYFGYNLTKSNPIQAALESLLSDDSQSHLASDSSAEQKLRDRYLNACSSYMVKSHSNRFKRNIMARNHLVNNRMDANQRSVDVFHYELKYKPSFSLAPDYIKTAAHGDDVPLIFGLVFKQPRDEMNEADLMVTRKMLAYIANFVHSNNNNKQQQQQHTKLTQNETNELNDWVAALGRRSWSSEGQIDSIEFNEAADVSYGNEVSQRKGGCKSAKLEQSNEMVQQLRQQPIDLMREPRSYLNLRSIGDSRSNVRIVMLESPDLLAQSVIELAAEQQKQVAAESDQTAAHSAESSQPLTRSQRLLDLHLQQRLLEQNNLWLQSVARRTASGNQQQAATMTLVNESSFITMLVFTSCLVIFTLMSVCLGLYLVIYRNSSSVACQKQGNSMHNFATNSTSSCNICGDDSQGGSMDAVLGAADRKDGRGFSNVFAKLRNSNNQHQQQHTNQCSVTASSTATGQSIPVVANGASVAAAAAAVAKPDDLARQRLDANKQQES